MNAQKPTSVKILEIVRSGHEVEMWHCDDEFTREEVNPGEPVKIHLRQATEEDGLQEDDKRAIEYRTRGGEVIEGTERPAGNPRIDELTKGRSWTVA